MIFFNPKGVIIWAWGSRPQNHMLYVTHNSHGYAHSRAAEVGGVTGVERVPAIVAVGTTFEPLKKPGILWTTFVLVMKDIILMTTKRLKRPLSQALKRESLLNSVHLTDFVTEEDDPEKYV